MRNSLPGRKVKTMKTNRIPSIHWTICLPAMLAVLTWLNLHAADTIQKTGTYEGTLQSVNLNDHNLTVRRGELSKTFQTDEHTSVFTLEKSDKATLEDLRSGYTVKVMYAETNGTAVASSISEVRPPATK